MWLSTRENRGLNEEEDMWNEIWQHQQIYTIFLRHILTKVQKIYKHIKGQLISKQDCRVITSPKKQTDKFVFWEKLRIDNFVSNSTDL